MDEGASVVFCSNFDAPYTFGTSISISASRSSSVRSAAFGFALISAAGAPRARERARIGNARRMSLEHARNAPVGGQERFSLFMLVFERMSLARVLASHFERCQRKRHAAWELTRRASVTRATRL